MAVDGVQNFLLNFPAWEDVGPLFLLPLPLEEFQIMPDFSQHLFRLLPDFFDQSFLRDHACNLSRLAVSDKLLRHASLAESDLRSQT
jgi:hypothetical protein